jgi:drug/metabolite transporter (DMT)-like permease
MAASEWLLSYATGFAQESLPQQGIAYAILALAFALIYASRRKSKQQLSTPRTPIAFAAVLFLGLPAILLNYVNGWLPSTSISALYTLTPIVAIFTLASRTPRDHVRSLLAPALAGMAGTLCILPLDLPASPRAWIATSFVILSIALSGISAVELYLRAQNISLVQTILISAVANAIVLLAWCGLRGAITWPSGDIAYQAAILTLRVAEIFLTLWLVRAMDPIPFAARYLVIPLLTILEGFILIHPPLTTRLFLGTTLLIIGSAWILTAKPKDEAKALSLK